MFSFLCKSADPEGTRQQQSCRYHLQGKKEMWEIKDTTPSQVQWWNASQSFEQELLWNNKKNKTKDSQRPMSKTGCSATLPTSQSSWKPMKLWSHKVWSRKEDQKYHLIILQIRKLKGREEIWLIHGYVIYNVSGRSGVPGGLTPPIEWFLFPSLKGFLVYTQEYPGGPSTC